MWLILLPTVVAGIYMYIKGAYRGYEECNIIFFISIGAFIMIVTSLLGLWHDRIKKDNKLKEYLNWMVKIFGLIGISLWLSGLIYYIIQAIIKFLHSDETISITDYFTGMLLPIAMLIMGYIQFDNNSKVEKKINDLSGIIQENVSLGDNIFNYVKSENKKGYNPTKEDIENIFGKNVTSNINGMVQSYKDRAIFKRDSGVHKKGEPRLYLEEVNGGYVAHDKKE